MAGGTGRMIRRLVGAGGGGAGGGGGGGKDGSSSKNDLIAAGGGGGGAGKIPSSSSWRSRRNRRRKDKANGCGDPEEPTAATARTEGESSPSSAVSASRPQLDLVTPSSRGDHDTVCSLSSGGTSAMTADPTPQCIGGGNGGGSDVPSSRPAAAACTPGDDRGERERAGDGGNQDDNNDDKDDANAASPTNDGELTSEITSDFRHLLEHGSFPGGPTLVPVSAKGGRRRRVRSRGRLASVASSMNNIFPNQRAGNSTPSDALERYESSLSLKRAALGPNRNDDLSIARTLNNVGSAHCEAGRYGEALDAYAESRSIMAGIIGPDHLDVATVRSNAGDALLASGDRNDEALVELREALRIRWEKLGPDHRKVIRLLEKIASSAASEGDGPGMGVGNGGGDDDGDGMLVDYFSDDDEADGGVGRVHREFGNLKVALLTDMDKVSTIGRELALDMVKERLAMLREIRSGEEVEQQQQERQDREVQEGEGGHVKCQVSAAHVQHVTDEGDHFDAAPTSTIAPLSDPSSSRQRSPCQRQREPPHIRSAHDGAVAVRDVRERLAKVQERRRRREQDL